MAERETRSQMRASERQRVSGQRRPAWPGNAAIVVTGSSALSEFAVAALPQGAVVIAADGGLDHARAAGLAPDVLIGDLDSVSADGLEWAKANIAVEAHPVDKAATDTELALAHAAGLRPERIVLVAGVGDRLDHAAAAVGALGAADLDEIAVVEAWWGDDHLLVARPGRPAVVDEREGTTFSALAMHGPCTGVTITGARWPLASVELAPLSGVGVSNEVAEPPVRVSVGDGVLTVIIPGAQP